MRWPVSGSIQVLGGSADAPGCARSAVASKEQRRNGSKRMIHCAPGTHQAGNGQTRSMVFESIQRLSSELRKAISSRTTLNARA